MKNPKKPTYDQKRLIVKAGLDWKSFLVKEENADALVLVDKASGELKHIEK